MPSTANQRWRSRTASQQNRRKKWTEPSAPIALINTYDGLTLLSSYSRPDYLVGNSTPQALADVRDRLGHDLAPMPAELSAVEGLIYEMADTSVPVEMEGSILVEVPQVIVEDEEAPSAHALPRKPPKIYWTEDSSNVCTSQPASASRSVPQVSVEGCDNESATAQNNDDLYDDLATSHAAPFRPVEHIYGSVRRPNEQQVHEIARNNNFHHPPLTTTLASRASTNSFSSEPDYSSSPTTLASRHEGLASTTTFDSILEERNDDAPDPKKAPPVKSLTRKGFRRIFG
jgi:hypothetical protein